MTTILVTGASGFIGRRLVPALIEAGHDVLAMTRHPETYDGAGTAVHGDVTDEDSLDAAMRGATVAYYLVHALDHGDFAERDARAAETFSRIARRVGLRRIVYLGGLGNEQDDLSPHLRSRQEVEGLLAADGVPVTTLRAGIVIGHGGASWKMIHNMVEKIPAMPVPTWALTRSQPIAVADVIRYLVGVLVLDDGASHTFDIGGAEVLRYIDILTRVSAIEGRPALVVPVPLPAKRLAAYVAAHVLPLVTGVDSRTMRTLLGSMRNEVVVRDDAIRRVVPFEPAGYDEAVLAALAERAQEKRSA